MKCKKTLALLLAVAALFSLTSVAAYAAEETDVFGYTEDGVYTNEHFDVSIALLEEDWDFFTEEELLQLQGLATEALSDSGYEYADLFEQVLETTSTCFVSAASQSDGLANFNLIVQYLSGLGALMTEDSMVEISMGETGFGAESLAGMYESIEANTYTLAGVEHKGVRLYSIDTSLGFEVPVYQQIVFIMGGDYALQITMTSFVDDSGIDRMAEFFFAPSAEEAA